MMLMQQELDAEVDVQGARELLAVRARAHLGTLLGHLQRTGAQPTLDSHGCKRPSRQLKQVN